MKAIIYSRVSTDAQERDGTSLDSQEAACVAYAERQGWQTVDRIREAASGYTLDRAGAVRLRDAIKKRECDVIVSYAVDRLSRNQNHIGVLFDDAQQSAVRLEFVTERFEDTAIGRFILAARAFIAEVEREKISERTMRGKESRARSGRIPQATGKGIYGYTYSVETGKRRVNESQARTVEDIYRRFAAGESCNGIATHLNRIGVPAFGGSKWYPLTIRRILENETYTGRTTYRRTKVDLQRDPRTGKKRRITTVRPESDWINIEGATPPIISGELYACVTKILSDPKRRLRGQPSATYRLRGHLRCALCDTRMVGQSLNRGRYRYYRCGNAFGTSGPHCSSRYVKVNAIEQLVLGEIASVLADPELVMAEARRLNPERASSSRLTGLRSQTESIKEKQRRLVRLYAEGRVDDEILDGEAERLSADLQQVTDALTELESRGAHGLDLRQLRRQLPKALQIIRDWVNEAKGDDLSLLLDALQVQVRATPDQVSIEGVVPVLAVGTEADYTRDLATIERTLA